MFNGLSLLVIVACWFLYKLACWIAEAPVIEDAPLSRLDRLDGRSDHA